MNVDPSGDSAWTIHSQWDQQAIQNYQRYAAERADQLSARGIGATCEDFVLRVLIDFASSNGLPLTIANGSGTYSAASDAFTDVAGFTESVLPTTGASDLQRSENAQDVDISQLRVRDLLLTRDNGPRANHAQLVTSMSGSEIGIHQGNTDYSNAAIRLAIGFVTNSINDLPAGNPGCTRYGGTRIQTGVYNVVTGAYTRNSVETPNAFERHNLQARLWNFGGW